MSAKSVMILDTSVLCVWLKVPGMETCGPTADSWDHKRVDAEIQTAIECGYTLVLPLAALIESGNHIAHVPDHRFETASRLAEVIAKSADRKSPWAAFTDQSGLWEQDREVVLRKRTNEFPQAAQCEDG